MHILTCKNLQIKIWQNFSLSVKIVLKTFWGTKVIAVQVESEFNEFKDAFVKHPHVHCDPNRVGDVVPNVFCQLNGKPMDFVLTCCPENKYHYLVNGSIGHEEKTTEEKIQTVQKVLDQSPKNCPTCKNLEKTTPLKAKYDADLHSEIQTYYDEKYEKIKESKFVSVVSLQILTLPVVPCSKSMHAFVDSNEAMELKVCPLCKESRPSLLKVHPFLDYALDRWKNTDEGRQAQEEEDKLNQTGEDRQANAPKNPTPLIYTPPVKPSPQPTVVPAPKKMDACSVRVKGLKRICCSALKLVACIGLIVLIGMVYVRYKDRIMNYRLVR